jgi:zinc protease
VGVVFDVASGRPLFHRPVMQKATPILLVLFLAATAMFLSLRSNDAPAPMPAAAEAGDVANETPEGPAVEPATGEMAAQTDPRPWPQEASDIPPDQEAVFGTLENGMRYIIYPNTEPPERVSLRLHIDAGSLMEDEDQRGVAHFLEHMVFNGSRNFAGRTGAPHAAPWHGVRSPRQRLHLVR